MVCYTNARYSDQARQHSCQQATRFFFITDRHRHLIGYVKIPRVEPSEANHIDITGVDASYIDVDNIDIPGLDVDIQDTQVINIIDPNIPPTKPAPIEPATLHQSNMAVETMPAIQQV